MEREAEKMTEQNLKEKNLEIVASCYKGVLDEYRDKSLEEVAADAQALAVMNDILSAVEQWVWDEDSSYTDEQKNAFLSDSDRLSGIYYELDNVDGYPTFDFIEDTLVRLVDEFLGEDTDEEEEEEY